MFILINDTTNKISGIYGVRATMEGQRTLEISNEDYLRVKDADLDAFIIDEEDNIIEDPTYQERQEQKEQDRINRLKMTPLDFIKLLKSTGLTKADIDTYLSANPDLDDELHYCQYVYCGIVRQLVPITYKDVTITDEMVVAAFLAKQGEPYNG